MGTSRCETRTTRTSSGAPGLMAALDREEHDVVASNSKPAKTTSSGVHVAVAAPVCKSPILMQRRSTSELLCVTSPCMIVPLKALTHVPIRVSATYVPAERLGVCE